MWSRDMNEHSNPSVLHESGSRAAADALRGQSRADAGCCGWYESSFELKRGLDVRELPWSSVFPTAFAVK
jgi:hypothetical protein